LDELPFTVYGFDDDSLYYLNQSFLSNVSLSIYTLCAKETSTYRRLCLHDAKNYAMWRAKCCPRICIAFERYSRRDFSRLLEEMCQNELFIVLCLKIYVNYLNSIHLHETWSKISYLRASLFSIFQNNSHFKSYKISSDIILVHFTNKIRVSFIIKTLTFLARICFYRARKAPLRSVIRLKKWRHSVFSFCSFII